MESATCPEPVSGVTAHCERPAVGSIFQIAGRSVLFESNGAHVPGLAELLAEFYCTAISPNACPVPDATIRWEHQDAPRDIAGHFEQFEISGGGVGSTDGRTCVFDFQNARIVAHAGTPHRIDVLVKNVLELESAYDLQVVNYALSTALRRCDLYELHSGAVVEPQSERGVLFAGPSGSGKSTLTLQLVARGWRYLTDDVLFLENVGGAMKAYPLRRAFAVTHATVEAAGEHVRQAFASATWSNGDKKPFMLHDSFPGKFLPECEPRAIFFPTITGEEKSVVTPLSHSETMIQLIKLCPWSCYDPVTSSGHLNALSLLAKQCQGFMLLTGSDVLHDPERASDLVSEHIRF